MRRACQRASPPCLAATVAAAAAAAPAACPLQGRLVTALPAQIAVEGCGHGELDHIYETMQYLERKEGKKIDLLICCGDFQVSVECAHAAARLSGGDAWGLALTHSADWPARRRLCAIWTTWSVWRARPSTATSPPFTSTTRDASSHPTQRSSVSHPRTPPGSHASDCRDG